MGLTRRALLVALAVLVGAGASASGTQVRLGGGRITVQANGAPLIDVLNRFSEATGAKIVYESEARPRQLVTVEIDAASEAEALSQLLEGQGLGYAVRLDPSGHRVEMLLLSSRTGAASSPRASQPPVEAPVETYAPEVEAEIQEAQEIVEGAAGGQPPPDAAIPVAPPAGSPPQGPIAAPGGLPAGPAYPAWNPTAPAFPRASSYSTWR